MPLILSRRFYTDPSTFSLNLPGIQTLQEPRQLITVTSDGVPDARSCRPELTYFTGKISKNRLVYKNAVTKA